MDFALWDGDKEMPKPQPVWKDEEDALDLDEEYDSIDEEESGDEDIGDESRDSETEDDEGEKVAMAMGGAIEEERLEYADGPN